MVTSCAVPRRSVRRVTGAMIGVAVLVAGVAWGPAGAAPAVTYTPIPNPTSGALFPAGLNDTGHVIANVGSGRGLFWNGVGFVDPFADQPDLREGFVAINDADEVAGTTLDPHARAFLWNPATGTRWLDDLDTGELAGSAINALSPSGVAVGSSWLGVHMRATRWDAAGHVVDVTPVIPGAVVEHAIATDVDADGRVAGLLNGVMTGAAPLGMAFVVDVDGTARLLGPANFSYAGARARLGPGGAVAWDDGAAIHVVEDAGLGPRHDHPYTGSVRAFGADGHVLASTLTDAFVWDPAADGVRVLTAPLGSTLQAVGMDDDGGVVGVSYEVPDNTGQHATYWAPDGAATVLGMGAPYSIGIAINDNHQVLGFDHHPGQADAPWLAQVVPVDPVAEPPPEPVPPAAPAPTVTATPSFTG